MAGIVNEAYTLDVNVQEAGAPEATVNVRAWNDPGTSVIDKTTDAQGDITPTVLIAEEHSITLTSTRNTTIFNPFNVRALKWLLRVLDVSINLSAPSKQTLFMETNPAITETIQATVQAYTGITFNHVGDTVTLDGLDVTPVNDMNRFYDRAQDEAIVNEQVSPPEVLATVDKQNYTLEYDWVIDGFNFAGQNRSVALAAGKSLTIQGAGGLATDLSIVGDVNLGTGTGGITLTNLNISNGALDFSIAGSYTLDNCQVDEITNSSGGLVTVNALNGSTFVTNTGPNINWVNTVNVAQACTDLLGSPVEGADVLLEAGNTGPLPRLESVSITRSGSLATVTHTNHGIPDGSEVAIRKADQQEYNGFHVVAVTNANEYTYTVSGTPASPATGPVTSTAVILRGKTDTAGLISRGDFNYTADQSVIGDARKPTTAPYFDTAPISGTITGAGYSQSVAMSPD